MTKEQFMAALDQSQPMAAMPEILISLWWDKKGDWDQAHFIAQNIPSLQGSAVHAYLHRKEGVMWNADYWYRRAGRKRPDMPLDTEWEQLVDEMVADRNTGTRSG